LDGWWQSNANGLEHGAGATGSGGPQAKPPSGLVDVGLHDLIDVADDLRMEVVDAPMCSF
jgi:hypothetical protein